MRVNLLFIFAMAWFSAQADMSEFRLIDLPQLDSLLEYSAQDANGDTQIFRRRDLNGLVDVVTQHTDDALHDEGENYPLWREYLSRPHPTVMTLRGYFSQASTEFGVPVGLLEAIGQVESNWTQMGPSIDQGWGVMHLVRNGYADTLGQAAAVLGVDVQVLQDDARHNIRGAAALLAYYAGEGAKQFTRPEDWFAATAQLSGLFDEELRQTQAVHYFEVWQQGASAPTLWGENVQVAANPAIDLTQLKMTTSSRRATVATDYAGAVADFTTCNYTAASNRTIDSWVNHWIGVGTAAGSISWFKNCGAQASAHFVVTKEGKVHQVVKVKDVAWHAGNSSYNQRSIGVEHEVTLANADALKNSWNTAWTDAMLKSSTDLARYFANQYNIPKVHPTAGSVANQAGIFGHSQVKSGSTTCPGTFPWDTWMSLFNGTTAQLHHFDGAGSLIAPSQSCWGCDKDEAKMHAHAGRVSTVAFQWVKTAQCDHIDLETTPNLGHVIIKTKTWDSHLTQSAYKLSLPGSVSASGTWNTTSIASTAPISSAVSVIARCKTASNASKGSRTTLANDLVALDSDYYWTGNGSLISSAGTGTGKSEDWAVTFNSHNSLTVFQWEAKTPSCDQLTLVDGAGATVSLSGDNGVMIKPWNADAWSQNLCTKLPCTTTAPGQGYYLLKVKSASNAVPSGQIKATCK